MEIVPSDPAREPFRASLGLAAPDASGIDEPGTGEPGIVASIPGLPDVFVARHRREIDARLVIAVLKRAFRAWHAPGEAIPGDGPLADATLEDETATDPLPGEVVFHVVPTRLRPDGDWG